MQKTKVNVIKSNRKTLALEIRPDYSIIVRAPMRASDAQIRKFVEQHEAWIERHLKLMKDKMSQVAAADKLTKEELDELGNKAMQVIPEKVVKYAMQLGVHFGRITIRNQHTRWGSCSSKGNLNFNCLLMLCPDEVVNYVVIHELCHRLEMNHSKKFWAHVEQMMPDYKIQKQWLKEHGTEIMERNI